LRTKACALFLLVLIAQAALGASAVAQELEVSILLNKREYSYSSSEVIDGYFSTNRASRVELWVQYPDQSWNLWVSAEKPAGTYKFAKNALEIPRPALWPGYNLLKFRVVAVDAEGNSAADMALAWLKV